MNSKRHRQPTRCGKRRGSALLLTLAVLALLLIIAIFFAFDVQMSKRLADNYRHSIQAKLLHECGINRAVAFIDDLDQFRDFDYLRNRNAFLAPAQLSFANAPSPWAGHRVFPLIDVDSPIREGLDYAYNASFLTGAGNWVWQLTPDTVASGVFDSATWDSVVVGSQVLGQYTYLIIDETGKIDPGYLSDTRVVLRRRLRDIAGSDIDSSLTADVIGDSCYSYAHLALKMTSEDDSIVSAKFIFPGTLPVKEEFWYDSVQDSICWDTEVWDRVDIRQVDNTISAQQLYAFLLTCDSSASASTLDTAGQHTSLWLQGVHSASDSMLARRYAAQLTASIMDFTDNDDSATIMYVDSSHQLNILGYSDTDVPTGVESIVYGAESGLVLVACGLVLGINNGLTPGSDSMLVGQIHYQLYNPFGNKINKVKANARVIVEGGPPPSSNVLLDFPISADTECNANYTTLSSDTFSIPIGYTQFQAAGYKLNLDTITIKSLQLYSNDDLTVCYPVDDLSACYPAMVTDSILSSFIVWTPDTPLSAESGSTTSNWNGYFEVNGKPGTDLKMVPNSPLQEIGKMTNLGIYPRDNWYAFHDISNSTLSGFLYDEGVITDSYTYSKKAYGQSMVKNSAISSLGDLGRVHSPHTPNRSVQFWTQEVAGQHDAYLLDMFTTDRSSKHKINMNTRSRELVDGLLSGTPLQNTLFVDYWLMNNATLTDSDGKMLGHPLAFRGDVYKFFRHPDPLVNSGRLNDPTQHDEMHETVIGNFIELMDTRQNYFTIIASGRSVDDIGSSNMDHRRKVTLGPNRYGIVKGNYKTISAVYRDAWGLEKPRVLRTTVLEE